MSEPQEIDFSTADAHVEADTTWGSPVQEHHIDFLLEEEFACNPAFLPHVINLASKSAKGVWQQGLPPAAESPNCLSVRSVTTDHGETDVLITYQSTEAYGRVAILIEDKIRAGFQKNQAERYRIRGEAGIAEHKWKTYWTCLVAPANYSSTNKGFDGRISVEDIASFFDGDDARSKFKAAVFHRVLQRFAQTGVRNLDHAVTRFRALYSEYAEGFFGQRGSNICWPSKRDAWSGDTWFRFTRGPSRHGVEIVHKAPNGFVDLAFSHTLKSTLERVAAGCGLEPGMTVVQTGKSASIRVAVEEVTCFEDFAAERIHVTQAFHAVLRLTAFYSEHESEFSRMLHATA